jgi:iron complex outermembrane receptor protein
MTRTLVRLMAGAAMMAISTSAWAQTPTGDRAGTSSSDVVGLGEIVVTAQRRGESLQDVPVAVQYFASEQLDAKGITSIVDLPQVVPGLQIAPTGTYTPVNLRGVGSNRNTGSVLMFVDDVYQPYSAGITQFVTVNGVEVDKGPQGTLFGRNATGGIIQLTTRRPSQDFTAEGELSYANYSTISGNFYLSGGLTDKLAADLSGYYADRKEGWGVNRATGDDVFKAKDYGFRTKWVYDLSDTTSFEFVADHTYSYAEVGANITPRDGEPLYNLLTRGPYTLPGKFDVLGEYGPSALTRQSGASIKAETELGGFKLREIFAYRKALYDFKADQDATPLDMLHAYVDGSAESYSNEFQITSATPPEWLEWVVGVFYFHSREDTLFRLGGILTAPVFGAPPGASYDVVSVLDTDAIAGYGQATAEVRPGTKLTFGARYTSDKREVSGLSRLGGPGAFVVPGSNGTQSKTFDKFTYKVSLDQRLTPDILGYVSYSTGFNSGSYNQVSIPGFNDIVNPAVQPETIKAWEVGLKSSFFDNRLRVNLSAFHYDYENLQLQVYNFGNISTINAAGAKIKGLDFEISARPMPNLTVNLSGEFLDAKYTSYPSAPLYVTCPSTVTLLSGAPACDATRGNGELISLLLSDTTLNGGRGADGKRAINAPEFSANFDVGYTIPTSFGDFLSTVSVSYRGKYYADAANAYQVDDVTLLNLSERWTSPDGKTYVQGWIKNATNERYDVFVNFATPVGDFGNPAAPKTYGVTVGRKF